MFGIILFAFLTGVISGHYVRLREYRWAAAWGLLLAALTVLLETVGR